MKTAKQANILRRLFLSFEVQTEKAREMLWRVSLKAEVEAKISKPSAAWQDNMFCLMRRAVQKAGRT